LLLSRTGMSRHMGSPDERVLATAGTTPLARHKSTRPRIASARVFQEFEPCSKVGNPEDPELAVPPNRNNRLEERARPQGSMSPFHIQYVYRTIDKKTLSRSLYFTLQLRARAADTGRDDQQSVGLEPPTSCVDITNQPQARCSFHCAHHHTAPHPHTQGLGCSLCCVAIY
jgi:hypothetical protein